MPATATRRKRCGSCQLVRINGMVCHELGCPEAWTSEVRECKECGGTFKPKAKRQCCCSNSCRRAYGSY